MDYENYYQRYLNTWYRNWYNKRWAQGATVIFFIAVIAIFGNMHDKKVQQTWAKVKAGDLIYADSSHVVDSNFTQLLTYRRIRPENAVDINKKKISKWKKLKLIKQLDTSAKHNESLMLVSNLLFLQNDMFKKNTTLIGTYIKRDSLTAEKPKNGLYPSPAKWFAIKPNRRLCNTNYQMDIPNGYVLADDYYYVDPNDVSLIKFNIK